MEYVINDTKKKETVRESALNIARKSPTFPPMLPLFQIRLKAMALAREAGDRAFDARSGICLISRDTERCP
jgi:hypothetical protein